MVTRAKFKCQVIHDSHYPNGGLQRDVILSPINAYNSENTEENKSFWDATPSGEIKLVITNKGSYDFFEPGKTYSVDFAEAE